MTTEERQIRIIDVEEQFNRLWWIAYGLMIVILIVGCLAVSHEQVHRRIGVAEAYASGTDRPALQRSASYVAYL